MEKQIKIGKTNLLISVVMFLIVTGIVFYFYYDYQVRTDQYRLRINTGQNEASFEFPPTAVLRGAYSFKKEECSSGEERPIRMGLYRNNNLIRVLEYCPSDARTTTKQELPEFEAEIE